MKTVSVRIAESDADILDIYAEITGSSRDQLVRRFVKLGIEIEGPVYETRGRALKEALNEVWKKRQAV